MGVHHRRLSAVVAACTVFLDGDSTNRRIGSVRTCPRVKGRSPRSPINAGTSIEGAIRGKRSYSIRPTNLSERLSGDVAAPENRLSSTLRLR